MAINPNGSEFRVNTTTSGKQITHFESPRSIAMDADGDFAVTWSSEGDGDGYGIYAKRYNAAGVAQGNPTEFKVNTTTSKNQKYSTIAMDADGDFVVTWSSEGDGDGYGIYAKRYNAAGVAQGSPTEFKVNTTTSDKQQYSSVAMDADGDFVVTWSSNNQDGNGWGIYAKRYNAAGVAQGNPTEFKVNTVTSNDQHYSSVAMDADGDFVVTWSSNGQDGAGWGIYAQRYNAAGVAQGDPLLVNTTTSGDQYYSSVAMDADGDFVITWNGNGQGDDKGIYARRYNAAGVAQGNPFLVNNTTSNEQRFSSVDMDANGGFTVTWTSYGQDGSNWGVYARHYNSAGIAQGNEFKVNTTTTNDQQYSSIAMDADGDFAIDWSGNGQISGQSDNEGVFAQRYQQVRPTLSIGDVVFAEGNSGTTNAQFTVTLSASSSEQVTVNYATEDGTAKTPGDYTSTTGTLTFTAGQTTKTITVPVVGDTVDEANETFKVNLSNPSSNATIADAQGIGTITDNDNQPTVSISPATLSKAEGNSGTTAAYTYTISLSNGSDQPVTVNYSTNNGTATTADGDYSDNDSSLTFNPGGSLSQTITVNANGDTKFENNETFFVKLDSATNATLNSAASQSNSTITNDDAAPTVSISTSTLSQDEGNTGTIAYTYTVSLSNGSDQPVTINYSTNDGTATTADGDYNDNDGTLTFNPGNSLNQTITVNANGDSKFEADEDFIVKLDSATNATLNSAAGQSNNTITNDDVAPTLSIDDVNITEGESGTPNAVFTVTLSAASGLPVTVDYTTADETAKAPSDYTSTSGSLTFVPGETTQTIAVPLSDDTIDEADKTFKINLSNPSNATISDAQGVGTITDNDAAPTVSISTSTLTQDEGNSGTIAYTYTVSLSNGSDQPVTINYSTNDGTATTADGDYSDNDGTLTFNPGEALSQIITVNANGDSKFEADETFFVKLDSATNATLNSAASQSNNTITNDDPAPILSIDDVNITEGESDPANAVFTVTLSAASGLPVTVDYTTADETAAAGNDYTSTSSTLTFAPGETTQTITVPLSDDSIDEADKTFKVNLSNPSNAIISDAQGVGTIEDNDPAPTVSISPASAATASQAEGNSGTTAYTYTVSLSNGSDQPISISYSTNDGTATTADGDYNDNDGTLTFNPGNSLSQTITVNANGDSKFEADETFFVKLDSATNATLDSAASQSNNTITNDDVLPNDGAGGRKQFTIREGDGTVALTNFDGVGEGTDPSLVVIDESDTLKLEGTGLTAGNLLLTQDGTNLEVSFKGVANTKVVLQNFSLENLDNLRKSTGASVDLGNILFNGQTAIQDNFDVFDANSTQTVPFRQSSVTFLNDLNNTVNGFDNSNDVINAQGGDDYIDGRSGNDLLRGGAGNDTLIGGTGNDLFAGDGGDDLLQGSAGADRFFYNTDRAFVSSDVGVDILPDFGRGADEIGLDKTTFTALNDGFSFQRVTSDGLAATSSADIVYSSGSGSTSGKLFYNPNGIADGFGTGAQFATLTNLASPLVASNFLVVE